MILVLCSILLVLVLVLVLEDDGLYSYILYIIHHKQLRIRLINTAVLR